MKSETVLSAPQIKTYLDVARERMAGFIRGKEGVIESVITCLVAGGHVLLEDLPGMGKTTLAYCLSQALDCRFSRVQFTSDLLPTDLIGVSVYAESDKRFIFHPGPIFSHILLADEINRSTPKTQSALLEVMDRARVSVDGQTHVLERPFMVFATQNPLDYEGTFPLPASQLDRFLMRLHMGYPQFSDELEVLERGWLRYDDIHFEPVIAREVLMQIQNTVRTVFVEPSVSDYILRLVTATRTESEFVNGISTRGSLALQWAAQSRALVCGRNFVIPEDVLHLISPVFNHRLSLTRHCPNALEERSAVDAILNRITSTVTLPE
jgi:MoxR-like ATPase